MRTRPPPPRPSSRPLRALAGVPTWALVLGVSAIWGSNFVAFKVALRQTTPLVLASARSLVGGASLVALALALGARPPRRRADLWALVSIAVPMPTVAAAALLFGLARLPAGLASLLHNTMPLFVVLLSRRLVGERASPRAMASLGVGFAGIALISLPAIRGSTSLTGVVLVLTSACGWAVGSLLIKRYELTGLHPLMAVGSQLLIAGLLLAIPALLVEPLGRTRPGGVPLVAFAWASLAGCAVAWVLWGELFRRATAIQASATAYLVPVFGVGCGLLFLGEALRASEAAGALLVLAGVAGASHRVPPTAPAVARPEPPGL